VAPVDLRLEGQVGSEPLRRRRVETVLRVADDERGHAGAPVLVADAQRDRPRGERVEDDHDVVAEADVLSALADVERDAGRALRDLHAALRVDLDLEEHVAVQHGFDALDGLRLVVERDRLVDRGVVGGRERLAEVGERGLDLARVQGQRLQGDRPRRGVRLLRGLGRRLDRGGEESAGKDGHGEPGHGAAMLHCRGLPMSCCRAWSRPAAALYAVLLACVCAGQDATERARRIHASLIGVDSHIDTLQRVLNGNEDISRRTGRGHVDLPRLKDAGMVAPYFALWVPTFYKGSEAVRRTLQLRDAMQSVLDAHPDQIELATTAADVERIARAGKIAAVLTLEGGHQIADDLAVLRVY